MLNNNVGIYKWTNLLNGKVYIGQSTDLERRKNNFLQFNISYAGTLINNARRKYNDIKNWKYEVLEYCEEDKLNEREIFYIDLYYSVNRNIGYNLCNGGLGSSGYKQTDEANNKNRISHLGKEPWNKGLIMSDDFKKKCRDSHLGKKLSEKTKEKLSELNKGEKSYWFGKHHTEETKEKIRLSNSGVNNHNYGKHFSEEHKRKIGDKNKKSIYQIDKNTGKIIKKWDSVKEASTSLNILRTTISSCLTGNKKLAGGYKWSYVEENKSL